MHCNSRRVRFLYISSSELWVDVVVVFPFYFFSTVLCSAASTLRRRSPLPFRIVSVVFSSLLGLPVLLLLLFFPIAFPERAESGPTRLYSSSARSARLTSVSFSPSADSNKFCFRFHFVKFVRK